MIYPHKYNDAGPTVWFHRDHSKSNQYCPYCGTYVGDKTITSNKEHLIGRNFIPKIYNNSNSFNFIFRTCRACNTEKSNLERHISSVTLFNSPACLEISGLRELALHKAKQDHHHLTRRSVDEAQQVLRAKSGEVIKFDFIVPTQIDPLYCRKLAFYHFQALFTLVTSSNPENQGAGTRLLPFDQFYYFGSFIYKDWGNPQFLAVEKRVRDWPCVALVNAAHGFFKAVIKKSVDGNWFWALEWNKYLRVAGGITNHGEIPQAYTDLPPKGWQSISIDQDGAKWRFKEEIPLPPDEDRLFTQTSWHLNG